MNDTQKNNPKITTKSKRVCPRKGRWSGEEKLRFKEGLTQYGRNWKKIQSYVKSRSLLQIRSHAQKYFIMQRKLEKRNKRWKKMNSKEELLLKSEHKEDIPSDCEDSLKRLNFIENVTDCPNFVEYNSNDMVYSPLTFGTVPVFEYLPSFQPVQYSNLFHPMGVVPSIVPTAASYQCPIPIQPYMMNINMNPNANMNMNVNLPLGRNVPFLGHPVSSLSGNFIY